MSDETWGMVMPFVVVKSKDGPYDDDAYVSGWEAGVLWCQLMNARDARVTTTTSVIHSENLPQADLIAMSFDYSMEVVGDGDGWAEVVFHDGKDPL